MDLLIALAAFVAAYLTLFTFRAAFSIPDLTPKLMWFSASVICSFGLFDLYRGSWRYVSIVDFVSIVKASATAVIFFIVVAFLTTRGAAVPRSVLILTTIYMIGGLTGARIAYRIALERFGVTTRLATASHNVLLYGLSDKAESFIRANQRAGGPVVAIAGILDDSGNSVGRLIHGVSVLGPLDELDRILARLGRRSIMVDEIVVTEATHDRKQLTRVLERANAHSIRVSRIPDLTDMDRVTAGSLLKPRPIEIGDLLPRPEVRTNLESVADLIEGRSVLVTGAGGSIGSELCRQIAVFGPRRFVVTDNSEYNLFALDNELREARPDLDIVPLIVDVRDRARVERVFADCRPDVVFHAAALKHVPLAEENPLEAVKTNVLGTRNVADAAQLNEARAFVMISTDKAVNPTSVMGATKRAAEAYCQALDLSSVRTRFKTVRFGNVLGSTGSVVPRFEEQIAAGGPVTVTHRDIVRYFMTIPEAVRLVLNASARGLSSPTERGRIMVLDMGNPVRILDLAERMIQLAGFKPYGDIDIVFTGLRRGEKLYEELFDPTELQESGGQEGYVLAAPRIADPALLSRMLTQFEDCVANEDAVRAIQVLGHLVPEYSHGRAAAEHEDSKLPSY
ncbi:MAG: polysaccharide biosynthesis protein [Rhizobiaceae bacterium]